MLIVSPQTEVRARLVHKLKYARWRTLEADGGAEALSKLEESGCHVLLLDSVLPDLQSCDGFQDAMLLTSDDGEPALVLSFWNTEENLRQAEAAPAPHRTSAARSALGADTQRDVRIYRLAFRASEDKT